MIFLKDFTRKAVNKKGYLSGEQFRKNVLMPALNSTKKIVVDLDGCDCITFPFLEEAFCEIVKEKGKDIIKKITILCKEDPYLIQEIRNAMYESV